MTGGQAALALDDRGFAQAASAGSAAARAPLRAGGPLIVIMATPEELDAHEALLALVAKASGRCAWQSAAMGRLAEPKTGAIA